MTRPPASSPGPPGDDAGVTLTDYDRACLAGAHGAGAALAMRIVLAAATAMGAPQLVDITAAHIDSCTYVGPISTAYAQRLVDDGARVAVPATVNIGSVDLLHPQLWRGDPEVAARARELMDLYVALGCRPTWTCAPYQLEQRPGFGQHVAWGESNAIVFANSVLGARTNRYGDFLDTAAAITGRAPLAGPHTDAGRRGEVLITVDVPDRWMTEDWLYPLLGYLVGVRAGSRIPVIDGIPAPGEDALKALGAAAASSGAIAMMHVVGVTPEAPSRGDAFGGRAPAERHQVTAADIQQAWRALSTTTGGELTAVCVGTPHFSVAEFETLVGLLGGDHVHPDTPLYVNTSRAVLAEIGRRGWTETLRSAGVRIVTDTCTYASPILGRVSGLMMTNSAKWAWYAPANLQVDVLFSSLRDCVRSAVAGKVQHDLFG